MEKKPESCAVLKVEAYFSHIPKTKFKKLEVLGGFFELQFIIWLFLFSTPSPRVKNVEKQAQIFSKILKKSLQNQNKKII